MKVAAVLTPAEIDQLPKSDLTRITAVVFDVLRATSTMTTALESGASAIYPAKDIAEAHAFRAKYPHALLGGERHGEKIEGFDLGNSPLEYRDLAGREIISTTTNGTIALRAVAHAQTVIAGALLNIRAVANYLATHPPEELLLVCAGTGRDFAIEDGLAAGALLSELTFDFHSDDAAKMLLALWRSHASDPFAALADSRNGRRLIERGRSAEVEWCSQVSVCATAGILSGEALRP
ncbi:MAG: 2-phosphosulfolactate phosphatase [Chthoniobacterales bacterium]